jgi:catechol 2,3-dioxygenase-like lactoylglutathione lyase family enzyme
MHENAARALQYYEDLPRRSGRPGLRLVDSEPRTRRRQEAEHAVRADTEHAAPEEMQHAGPDDAEYGIREDAIRATDASGPEIHVITLDAPPAEAPRRAERRRTPPGPATARGGAAIAQRGPVFPIRRRQAVAPRIAGRPDRVAMWAVLLGFFLTAVAAATGHG